MGAKEHCNLLLARLSLRSLKYKIDECFIRGLDRVPVDFEKQQCGLQAHALIAINEGMVLHEMKQIRGSHLEDVSVQVLATEHYLGLCQRRFEQSRVANTVATAM